MTQMPAETKRVSAEVALGPVSELTSPLLRVSQGLMALGVICCFQIVIAGLVGVVRGYSVQGYWPIGILFAGMVLIMVSGQVHLHPRHGTWFVVVCLAVTNLPRGGQHAEQGDTLFKQGRYREAVPEYEKELNTWYLRLTYNYHEAHASEQIAKGYCELEQFDKARAMYRRIMAMYPGFYGDRAKDYLDELDAGERLVRQFDGRMPRPNEFPSKWYDVANAYQFKMKCARRAVDVCRQIDAMDIEEKFKDRARTRIKELTPRLPK
ncbi:MAG: tetratricopeptide repeat protein [Phycisphaerae bacterium]|nr:tetratricopeptide repeat protein [Phycisphaerae bacterium]